MLQFYDGLWLHACIIYHVQCTGLNKLPLPPGLGYSGFQVTGMIEWGQKSKPKKILRASNKIPKKSLDQKLTQKNPMPNF